MVSGGREIMTNLNFQKSLLGLVHEGFTVLTETERFSHQLLRRARLKGLELTRKGWTSPPVLTFNLWAERFWGRLWPKTWPASRYVRWGLLARCIEDLPPPEPLVCDIPLVLTIDESFEHCLRYGISPGDGEPSSRLVEWRRELWRAFQEELSGRGLFHPAALPERLHGFLMEHPERAPHQLAVVGFELAGTWEKAVFDLLRKQSGARVLDYPRGLETPKEGCAARVFTDPEQELYGLIEDVASAASRHPLHELAVVVLDDELYGPLVARHFGDVFGPPLIGELAGYNLPPERSLAKQPLFQAALLPVDFACGGQSRRLMLSLLRSPYYGRLARSSRALSRWDRIWRSAGLERGLRELIDALPDEAREALPQKGNELLGGLTPFVVANPQRASAWVGRLRDFWTQMDFPVLAGEIDQMAWQHLQEITGRIESEFGPSAVTGAQFAGWLRAAAERVRVQKTGHEDAGIQVLGQLEVRGLAFRRIIVPGLVAGALPQAVRSLPFLSLQERKRVQGGTAESQFAFARHLFNQLEAVAPERILSRPAMSLKREPLLPSPFWPEKIEEKVRPVVPWRDALPALQRAAWVTEAVKGMAEYLGQGSGQSDDPPAVEDHLLEDLVGDGGLGPRCETDSEPFFIQRLSISDRLSVSALETILHCPSRFFFREILCVEELREIQRGLDPLSRGERVHRILMVFGRKLAREEPGVSLTLEGLSDVLSRVVLEELDPYLSVPHWRVEMKRLLGTEDGDVGVLRAWLEHEWSRFRDGWRWVALESSFDRLMVRGCTVAFKGRVDRLDFHPEEGFICWDYKTGKLPLIKDIYDSYLHPQLPLYLLAVRNGLLREVRVDSSARTAAGYIDLRSVRQLKHPIYIKATVDLNELIERWQERVAEAVNELQSGNLSPRWKKTPCDVFCPYVCLCGLLSAGARDLGHPEDGTSASEAESVENRLQAQDDGLV